MLITLKSKFTLFRHSEVLRLRRELRLEKQLREAERENAEQRMEELRISHADELMALRMGFNVHEERLRGEWATEREKLVDFLAVFKFGRSVYAEKSPAPEMQPTGYMPPQMRRAPSPPPEQVLGEEGVASLEKFRKESS